MRRQQTYWLVGALVLILSGCASEPVNPWLGATVETDPATTPLACGKWPLPSEVTATGDVVYDNASLNDLDDYRACAEANEAIAGEHAAQIGQLKVSRKALVEAGQAQRNIATMKQKMLEDERRHHFFQSLGYWILIIGAIAL